MTLRRPATIAATITATATATVLLALVGTAGALSTTAAAGAPPAAGRVVYYNLGSPEVRPERVFTAFSSSPYVDRLTWRHWGTAKAVGRGVYVSDCASCAGPERRRAIIVLAGLETCADGTRTYRRAKIRVSSPDEGSTRTTYRLETGCHLAHD